MSVKIYSWNVNGIRAVVKKGLWQPFIDEHQPDFLCLQETKATPDQIDLDMPGYHAYWNSADKKGYSGTAIFSKQPAIQVVSGLPADLIKKYDIVDDGYGDPTGEGRVVSAEFDSFWLSTVYTPNAKDDLSRLPLRHQKWDAAYCEYMKRLEQDKPVIFCGDLNVAHTPDDLARPKPNVGKKGFTDEERAGFEEFVKAGFIDTFRLFHEGNGYYSWWSHFAKARERNVGWRIDYVLVSEVLKLQVEAANIHADVMGSDHCPVSITLAA